MYLEWAVDRGYGQREWAENDPDLEPVRGDPRFSAILSKVVVPVTQEARVSA